MRSVVVAVFFASTLVSCKESEPAPVQPETADEAAQTNKPKLVWQSGPGPVAPIDPASPQKTTPREPLPEKVPASPFLVPATPTQQPPSQAFVADPPPLPPPPPPPAPTPPRTWGTSANNTGKPCPVGRCLLNGKCVIPGGPIGRPGLPPDAVSGACGGDGGECSRCRCVSTGTLISTPQGETPIEDLHTNDLVWSIHQGSMQVVPIRATQRLRVHDHSMARIQLQDGFVLEISGEHPTGDGRALWDLKLGETFGNAHIEGLTVVPYEGNFTYDILPESDTGTYFVHGMWIGSTMFGQHVRGDVFADP